MNVTRPRQPTRASEQNSSDDVHETPTLTRYVPQTGISGEHRMPPLVLIADDNADSRAMYAEYLAYVGFRVLVADNGEEAVKLALQTRPDLILMDVMMPRLDGYEATRSLRADERTQGTTIVAITCLDRAGAEAQMRDAGCDLLVTKPFLPEELERLVSELLAKREGQRAS